MSTTSTIRLELPPDPAAPSVARSFVTAVARASAVVEDAIEDLRIAVAGLVGAEQAADGSRTSLVAEVGPGQVVFVVPARDGGRRVAMLSGLSMDVHHDREAGTVRLTVPVEP